MKREGKKKRGKTRFGKWANESGRTASVESWKRGKGKTEVGGKWSGIYILLKRYFI
jgi:hypothetical protein